MPGGRYEHRGIAQIERLGDRLILNVYCNGIHATYIDDPSPAVKRAAGSFVNVRYRWVDRTADSPACVRAPCQPVTERRVAIEEITDAATRAEDAAALARACRGPEAK